VFSRLTIRDRKQRRTRRPVVESLETRQLPSNTGVGHLLVRFPAHVVKAHPLATQAGTTPDAPDTSTITVPLKQVKVGNQKRLAVKVTVAGTTRSYLLDTGSSGMFVAKYGLNPANYSNTKQKFVQKYSSKIKYTGTVMKTTVSFAGGPTASCVEIGLIDTAKHIPGWTKRLRSGKAPYDDHFYGTLGMSLMPGKAKKGGLYSIIAQLPGNLNSGFIIHAANTKGDPPYLTVGLNSANTQGFATMQMPAANGSSRATPYARGNGAKNHVLAWNDKGVALSYQINGMPPFSAPTVFDTGNPTTTLYTGNVPRPLLNGELLRSSLLFRAYLASDSLWQFRTGDQVNVNRVFVNPKTRGTVNTGIGLFFHYDVMYDLANGRIGFRPIES
jgi:hypothetical protein